MTVSSGGFAGGGFAQNALFLHIFFKLLAKKYSLFQDFTLILLFLLFQNSGSVIGG